MNPKKEIKNIKISPESHDILKKYCDKRGIKIYKFLSIMSEYVLNDHLINTSGTQAI